MNKNPASGENSKKLKSRITYTYTAKFLKNYIHTIELVEQIWYFDNIKTWQCAALLPVDK